MTAIFAGTFDPFTIGHMNIAMRAARIFGNVVIAVAADTGKNSAPLEARTDIAKRATRGVAGISVEPFCGLLSDYVAGKGECVLVRGVRSETDFSYERDLSRVYKSLCGVQSVFLSPDAEVEHVSSTVVRQLLRLGGKLDGYVVPGTEDQIKSLYGANRG